MLIKTLWLVLVVSQASGSVRALKPGELVEGRPADGVSYEVALKSDEISEVTLEQLGADLSLMVEDPSGAVITLDTRESGPERLLIGGVSAGTYKLKIVPVKVLNGSRYRIVSKILSPVTERDRSEIDAERALTLAKMAAANGTKAQLEEARTHCREALSEWQSADGKIETAITGVQLAEIEYALGNFETARTILLGQESIIRDSQDKWAAGEYWNNLGITEWQLAHIREAFEALQQSLTIWRQLGYRYGEAGTRSNLGILYRETGSYTDARSNYYTALGIIKSLGDRVGEAYISNNLGIVEAALGNNKEALESLDRAIRLFRANGQRTAALRATVRTARIYASAENVPLATSVANEALPEVQASGNRRLQAELEIVLGQIAVSRRESAEAKRHFGEAIRLFTEGGNSIGKASALQMMGSALRETGEVEAAETAYQEALTVQSAAGVWDAEIETLYQLGRLNMARERTEEARDYIDRALQLIERLRSWLAEPHLRMSYLAVKHDVYQLAIDIYMRLAEHHPGQGFEVSAFEISERARVRALLDMYIEPPTPALDRAAREKFDTARQMLNYWSAKVADAASGEAAAVSRPTAQREVDRWLSTFRELEEEAHKRDPRYATADAKPLTAAQIRGEVLDPDTLLLEYALGEQGSVVWAVTQESIAAFELPSSSVIEAAANSLYRCLASDTNRPWRRDATKVAQMLLTPVAGRLNKQRIIIAVDGTLKGVPFALLPIPGTETPMCSRFETTLVGSASALKAHRTALAMRANASRLLVIMADPVYDTGDKRVPESARRDGPIGFARLAESRREATALAAIAGPANTLTLTDFSANRRFVLEGGLQPFRYVHFSVHEWLDAKYPELSSLVLARVAPSGSAANGFLRAHEIESLRLSAELVVLGACRSALGPRYRAEGVVDLGRSFLSAGAARVMTSLWDVDDESTAEFMQRFYKAMLGRAGARPAAALRHAQLSMRGEERWRSPHYWAAWVLEGEW